MTSDRYKWTDRQRSSSVNWTKRTAVTTLGFICCFSGPYLTCMLTKFIGFHDKDQWTATFLHSFSQSWLNTTQQPAISETKSLQNSQTVTKFNQVEMPRHQSNHWFHDNRMKRWIYSPMLQFSVECRLWLTIGAQVASASKSSRCVSVNHTH